MREVEQQDGTIRKLLDVVDRHGRLLRGTREHDGGRRRCRRCALRLASQLEDRREAAAAGREYPDGLVVAPESGVRHAIVPASRTDLQVATIDDAIDQWRCGDRDV